MRALALQGRRYHCKNCGERMFVRFESGLCPMCFNGRRPNVIGEGPVYRVAEELALAGVLDDPCIESPRKTPAGN